MKKIIKNGYTRHFYEVGDKVTHIPTERIYTVKEVDGKAKKIITEEGTDLELSTDVKGCDGNKITVIDLRKKVRQPLNIKIRYFDKDMLRIEKIEKGDWIDLRSAEDITLKKGEFKLIPLGVAMELPRGFEAHVVPRSSTFKNYHIIQTNGKGVIDETYKGDNDQWFVPVYALGDTKINKYDRICQFRIVRKMPAVNLIEVDKLENENRGGHGSTGVK